MAIDKIPYTFVGPYMDASVPSSTLIEGKLGRIVGADGRYKGCVRKFFGMAEVKDIDEISTLIDTYNGPYYMKAVTFQKRGTSSVYRGFVIAWDEANDTSNLAVDLFYTLDNGSNWASHEIWAQAASGITSTTEIDCAVDGAFLFVAVDGKATKTVYWKTAALTTVDSGPGAYSAELAALTKASETTDSTYNLRGNGVYTAAYRFYDSTRGIYSALSDPLTVSLDLFKYAKATGTIIFDDAGGDSGLMIDGDVITVGEYTYEACDQKLLLNFDGSDGATLTTDDSNNLHTVSFNGTAQLDTGVKKYGTASLLLDGNSDYLSLADSPSWDLIASAADTWSIGFWVSLTNRTKPEVLIGQFEDWGNFWAIIHVPGSGLRFYAFKDGAAIIDTGYSGEIVGSTLTHVALVKIADEYGLYKDGTQIDYVQDASTDTLSGALLIGARYGSTMDFTKFTELDPDGDLSATASTLTVATMQNTITAYTYFDYGAGYFTGDFTHRFKVNVSAESNNAVSAPYVLSNTLDSVDDLASNHNQAIVFLMTGNGAGGVEGYFEWCESNVVDDTGFTLSLNTDYYVTISRDDDGGTNSTGRYTAVIRTGSHTGSIVDTLTVDAGAGEQRNLRYVMSGVSYEGGGGGAPLSMTVVNLSLSDTDYGDFLGGSIDELQIRKGNAYGAAPTVAVNDSFTAPTGGVPDLVSDVEVDISTLTTVLQNTTALANAINGSSDHVTARATAEEVIIEHNTRGASGNTHPLAVSETGASTNDISISGATLTGGGVLTEDPEIHCKAVLNFPADDAVIPGTSTFAGFNALFDKVDIFRSINLGDVVSTEGAILYLEQTLDMPASEAAWDAPLTVTIGTKLDESLPFQVTYDPEKDIVLPPPQSGTIGRYEKITFMAEATGVDSLAKSDYDTVHSSLEHVSPEYFTTYNRRKGTPDEGRPLRFINAGSSMLILEPNAVVHVYKSTDLKPLVYTTLHKNRGLTGKYAAHAVGNAVLMLTGIGLVMVDVNTGEMSQISVANRVLLGDWLSTLSTVQSAFDSHMNASFFLNPSRSEMIVLWHSTKTMTMLEGANFVACDSTVDITATTNKKTRAYFITATGLIVTPDYLRAGTGTMWGLATGTTLNGTTTSASAGKNHCIDSGATFHADMVGALLYWTSGNNAGEAVKITAVASGDLTTVAATNAVAVGDRYAISPVPFKVRCWPLQIPDVVSPFMRWILKGMTIGVGGLSGFTSNDNAYWRLGAYRNGGDSLQTATGEADVDDNPSDSAGAIVVDGITVEPYIEQISCGTDFELESAEMWVTMGDSRKVT